MVPPLRKGYKNRNRLQQTIQFEMSNWCHLDEDAILRCSLRPGMEGLDECSVFESLSYVFL